MYSITILLFDKYKNFFTEEFLTFLKNKNLKKESEVDRKNKREEKNQHNKSIVLFGREVN